MTDWMIRGLEIATCNCDYSCPCQFNALPTTGDCRAAVAMQIDEGHHGKVRLDGLRWVVLAAWPQAIHMGHGEALPILDERATEEQRNALLSIMGGMDTEPGATFFQVFASTFEKMHEPMFKAISFSADMAGGTGHFSVAGVVDSTSEPIRNPVTGLPHRPKVTLRESFEFTEAEFVSSTTKSQSAIALDNISKHGHIAMLHMTGKGLVH